MNRPNVPGWYILTPAGYAGPYRWRDTAVAARPLGQLWPIHHVAEPCGCGGLCDSTEPCPMGGNVADGDLRGLERWADRWEAE